MPGNLGHRVLRIGFKEIFELDLITSIKTEAFIYYHVCYQVGIQMFVPDKTLKGIITESLKNDEKSISSLHRELKGEGIEVHRLILTGYLRAMEDMHVLRAKEIPPSKVYGLPVAGDKDIYELVGKHARSIDATNEKRAAIATFTLQRIFHRPVFLEEIERTGLADHIGSGIVKVSNEERQEVKRVLNKRGLKVRYNDPAYSAKGVHSKEAAEIILEILVEKFKVSSLVIDTKQTKLGV